MFWQEFWDAAGPFVVILGGLVVIAMVVTYFQSVRHIARINRNLETLLDAMAGATPEGSALPVAPASTQSRA